MAGSRMVRGQLFEGAQSKKFNLNCSNKGLLQVLATARNM